jgi:Protein of unknown function (DUF1804)
LSHSVEMRQQLRKAYIYEGFGLDACAQKVNISYSTASKWKKQALAEGDDWDKARSARMLSSDGAEAITQAVLEEFVTLFQSTISSIKDDEKASGLAKAEAISRLADAYHKTMSAARKGSPEVGKLATGMDVLNLLADFIGEKYPQYSQAFLEVLEPFGQHLTKVLV